jgi:hypothetical protein
MIEQEPKKNNVWSILIKVLIAALSALTGAIAGNAMCP